MWVGVLFSLLFTNPLRAFVKGDNDKYLLTSDNDPFRPYRAEIDKGCSKGDGWQVGDKSKGGFTFRQSGGLTLVELNLF